MQGSNTLETQRNRSVLKDSACCPVVTRPDTVWPSNVRLLALKLIDPIAFSRVSAVVQEPIVMAHRSVIIASTFRCHEIGSVIAHQSFPSVRWTECCDGSWSVSIFTSKQTKKKTLLRSYLRKIVPVKTQARFSKTAGNAAHARSILRKLVMPQGSLGSCTGRTAHIETNASTIYLFFSLIFTAALFLNCSHYSHAFCSLLQFRPFFSECPNFFAILYRICTDRALDRSWR